MAGTLADPAAVTLLVYLEASRPLPGTWAQRNLPRQVPRFRSFPRSFKEKWRGGPVSTSQLQDGPQKGLRQRSSWSGILDSVLFYSETMSRDKKYQFPGQRLQVTRKTTMCRRYTIHFSAKSWEVPCWGVNE